MSNRTAEEQLLKLNEVMGPDLGPVFHHLWQRFVHLSVAWDFVCTLSYTEERWKTVEYGIGSFVDDFYWIMVNSTVSGLMRLLDPLITSGQTNLTLRQLGKLAPAEIAELISDQLDVLNIKTVALKEIRHKLLSHNDLDYSLSEEQWPLYPPRLEISQVFREILKLLNIVELHYESATTVLLPLGNRPAFRLLNQLHLVEFILNQEREADKSAQSHLTIDRKELHSALDFFEEEKYEMDRYELPL